MFAKVKTNRILKYPYGVSEFLQDNPHTAFDWGSGTFDDIFSSTDAYTAGERLVEVVLGSMPELSTQDLKTKKIVLAEVPRLVDGVWTLVYDVVTMTAQEQADDFMKRSSAAKTERNKRLQESDFSQLADVSVDKAAWATYRQALRDVTAQPDFPYAITYPASPLATDPTPTE